MRELQGAITGKIQGANQEALQSLLQGAFKVPPYRIQVECFEEYFTKSLK